MDRPKLDKLYLGSRGKPARVFTRAATEDPLEASTYDFLLAHADELEFDSLLAIFNAHLPLEVEFAEEIFVRRLRQLVPSAGIWGLLQVLALSRKISARAWLEDLTVPLKGKLPGYEWYRFLDKARGGDIFNALNTGMPMPPGQPAWNPDESIFTTFEEQRPEPLVAALLERAHDDFAAADLALKTQPVVVLLRLRDMFPNVVTREAIQTVLPTRASSTTESWAPPKGTPPLPDWMAPFVVERLHHCDDAEARDLYDWLVNLPAGSHQGDAFDLAVARFKIAVSGPPEVFRQAGCWSTHIGKHLSTGAAWKTRGRDFVALCMDLGKGFPPETLNAALAAAAEKDGASAEKHRQSILRKVHDVTAKLLAERAEAALRAGDFEIGDLCLSAFMSLDPGSFIGGAVHHLRKIPNLPPGIVDRIGGCEELAGAGGREPTDKALLEAFLVLTGQVP